MIIIGEKINGTRKEVREAVTGRDAEFIVALARRQAEAGASYLDVNAGTSPDREPDDLVWLVRTVEAAVQVPLCLDSANPKALAAALAEVRATPMVNSISGEPDRLEHVLPLVAARGCSVIALALDDQGIPKGVEGRMAVIARLFAATRAAGLADDKVYVDPLILAVATENQGGAVALETMRRVRAEYPQAHLTAGLSNVSFGLPARSLVNQAFLTLAIAAGLDSAILDPTDPGLTAAALAAEVVLGRDRFCLAYNRAYRAGRIGRAG
ncbi:MAG: dihydropteroate synthase [Deferrisomatales bacterium]